MTINNPYMNLVFVDDAPRATVTPPRRGWWKAYHDNPGDMDSALCCAAHCAKRDNRSYVVFPGNSYGWFVWRILGPERVHPCESHVHPFIGFLVNPAGEVYKITRVIDKTSKGRKTRKTQNAAKAAA